MTEQRTNPTAEFLHHLHDTIILLGGGQEIADMVKRCGDGEVTEEDVDRLRQHTIKLMTLTKDRLVNVNKLTVQVG